MKDRIDMNLVSDNAVFADDMVEYDILKPPFKIYGGCPESGYEYCRIKNTDAERISSDVADRAARCAGLRLKFKTNSKKIGIAVEFLKGMQFSTQSALAAMGFDIYVNNVFCKPILPPDDFDGRYYQKAVELDNDCEKDITLYFPYNSVIKRMNLFLSKNSYVSFASEYSNKYPVIFYGSSITHGFCSSRPGNTFTSMISRNLNIDYINLGFSGACRGEKAMARYMAEQKKLILVCEYDHNAKTVDELKNTHLNFYKEFRKYDSKTPIIFFTRPNQAGGMENVIKRVEIVEQTCEYAKRNGDNNVYFINGQTLFPDTDRCDCTIDGVHPNDIGAYYISKCLGMRIEEILNMLYERNKNGEYSY